KLRKLEELDLAGCRIGNEGLKRIRELSNLKDLNLCDTNISEGFVDYIKGNTKLEHLLLAGTKVENADVAKLTMFWSLTSIDLERTGVIDAGVIPLARLKRLTVLKLANTKVSSTARKLLRKTNPDIGFYSMEPE